MQEFVNFKLRTFNILSFHHRRESLSTMSRRLMHAFASSSEWDNNIISGTETQTWSESE